MAERRITREGLESVLLRAAPATPYPATPDLRARVARSIEAQSGGTAGERRAGGWRLALAAAAAGAVVLAGAALALPGSRKAVADFFGIEGSEVQVLPTPAPGVTPTPLPASEEIRAFATPTTLEGASRSLGFDAALPKDAAEPERVWMMEFGTPVVVLEYERFDLWQARLGEQSMIGKLVPPGVTIRDLQVNGRPARWIAGGGHVVRIIHEGTPVDASVRTVDRNTLIWATDFAFYRIETDLALDEALAIAITLP